MREVWFSKLITPFLAHTVQRAMMGVPTAGAKSQPSCPGGMGVSGLGPRGGGTLLGIRAYE